jgi:hypothetical protein
MNNIYSSIVEMDIYNKIQAITNIAQRRQAIKELSQSDKKKYETYQTNVRQKRFMQDVNNREKVYAEKREYHKRKIQENPEKAREVLRGYVARFRERQKHEANDVVKSILNDVIDNVVVNTEKAKKAKYMREYRARKKLIKV